MSRIHGYVEQAFLPVSEALDKQLRGDRCGGAAVCIYHRGRKVMDVWAGEKAPGEPWEEGTLALSFSTTKGVMATLAHRLVDRGALDYDDAVAKYWPEFAQS